MSDKKNRILLIENQQVQFQSIYKMLPEYEVFPRLDKYEDFMIWVRIWVTTRYSETRRKGVLKKIITEMEKDQIDLIIMDYKLCGNHEGNSGYQLADELLKEKKFESTPVIILSRTPKTSKELEEDKVLLDRFIWVEKGYAGMNILEKYYFDRYVKARLIECLGPVWSEYTEKLNKVADYILVKKFHNLKIQKIKSVTEPGPLEEELINCLYANIFNVTIQSKAEIDTCFKNYFNKKDT